MNPLFQTFSRYVRDRALREFQASTTGTIVKEIERLSRSRSKDTARLSRLTRDLVRSAGTGNLGRIVKGSEVGQFAAEVQKYARGGLKGAALDVLFGALGPLGDVFRAFLRPKGRQLTGIQREIEAAYNLLRVFRPDLVKQPSETMPSGAKSKIPPAAPRSTTTTQPQGLAELPPDAAEARKLLETLGFTVTPSTRKPGQQPGKIRTPAGGEIPIKSKRQAPPYRPDDPIMTGQMLKVESSNVHSIGFIYDHEEPAHSVLKVRFLQSSRSDKSKKVPGPMYFYYRVPPAVFDHFRVAASKGKFVWDKLRVRGTVSGHQFQYELKGIAQEYVPRKAARFGPNEYFISRRVKVQSVTGTPMGYRESELGDQYVQPYAPNRGRKPGTGQTRRRLGPQGPRGPRR